MTQENNKQSDREHFGLKGNVKYERRYCIEYKDNIPPNVSVDVNHFDENGNLLYMQEQSSPDSPVNKQEFVYDDNGECDLYLFYGDEVLIDRIIPSFYIHESEHYKNEKKKNEWLYLSMYGKSSPDPCQYNIVYEEFINKEKYKEYEEEDRREKEKERHEEEKKEDFYRNHPYHAIYNDKNQLIEETYWFYDPYGPSIGLPDVMCYHCFLSNYDEQGNWLILHTYESCDGIHETLSRTTHRVIEYY